MKNYILIAAAALAILPVAKAELQDGGAKRPATIKITADKMAADNITGTVVMSGRVHAVSHPVCLISELVSKRDDVYEFSDPTKLKIGRAHV